jgi:hypothetical protein
MGKVWRMSTRGRERREEAKGIDEGGTERGAHALDVLASARSVIAADSERTRSCTAALEYFSERVGS